MSYPSRLSGSSNRYASRQRHQRSDYQRHDRHQLNQNVHRRAAGVLEWIADRVADDSSLVSRAAFSLPFEGPGAFLADEQFVKECRDAFKYAKDARLLRLKRTDTRVLAAVPPDELNAYAKDIGLDFLLLAQITELKASKPPAALAG